MVDVPREDELDEVVAFVARQQARLDRRISYVGDSVDGIAAELDGLSPPWRTTVRVARPSGGGGRGVVGGLAGVVVAEWDEDLGRCWVVGPWVDDAEPWGQVAGELVDAALAQAPPGMTRHEMAGEVDHQLLAALAAARGWTATEVNHVLVADAAVVAGWGEPPESRTAALRDATPDDVAGIAALHDVEFPGTHTSAEQLVAGRLDGSRVVLVADSGDGAGLAGYAAGEVHDDGEGFVDYVVVDSAARRSGLGAQLVVALTRRLLPLSSTGRVALTVQDHRAPARALYRRLGFRTDGSLVAYRSWA